MEDSRSLTRGDLGPRKHSGAFEGSPQTCTHRACCESGEVIGRDDTVDHVGNYCRPWTVAETHRHNSPLPSPPDGSVHSLGSRRSEECWRIVARMTGDLGEDSGTISEANSSGFHTLPIMPATCDSPWPPTVSLTQPRCRRP